MYRVSIRQPEVLAIIQAELEAMDWDACVTAEQKRAHNIKVNKLCRIKQRLERDTVLTPITLEELIAEQKAAA